MLRSSVYAVVYVAVAISSSAALGDVGPANGKKFLEVCYIFDEAGGTDHVLLGALQHSPTDGSNGEALSYEKVPTDACLPSGYFASYSVVAVTKADWGSKTTATLPEGAGTPAVIPTSGRTSIASTNPVTKRTYHLKIAGIKDGKVTLYASKAVDELSGGGPPETKDFAKPTGF